MREGEVGGALFTHTASFSKSVDCSSPRFHIDSKLQAFGQFFLATQLRNFSVFLSIQFSFDPPAQDVAIKSLITGLVNYLISEMV